MLSSPTSSQIWAVRSPLPMNKCEARGAVFPEPLTARLKVWELGLFLSDVSLFSLSLFTASVLYVSAVCYLADAVRVSAIH